MIEQRMSQGLGSSNRLSERNRFGPLLEKEDCFRRLGSTRRTSSGRQHLVPPTMSELPLAGTPSEPAVASVMFVSVGSMMDGFVDSMGRTALLLLLWPMLFISFSFLADQPYRYQVQRPACSLLGALALVLAQHLQWRHLPPSVRLLPGPVALSASEQACRLTLTV